VTDAERERTELLVLAARLIVASEMLARRPCQVYGLQGDCVLAAEAIRRLVSGVKEP
jgi:hypothetical protein